MNPGDMFKLEGYELMAVINYHSSDAVAVVVHNNSTHLIAAVIPHRQHGPLMMQEARYVESWRYDEGDDFNFFYGEAVDKAVGMAIGDLSDGS